MMSLGVVLIERHQKAYKVELKAYIDGVIKLTKDNLAVYRKN